MGEVRKLNIPEEAAPALEPIKLPSWVEDAVKIGIVAMVGALAKGMSKWAEDQNTK